MQIPQCRCKVFVQQIGLCEIDNIWHVSNCVVYGCTGNHDSETFDKLQSRELIFSERYLIGESLVTYLYLPSQRNVMYK